MIQPTISLEMPVSSQGHYGFPSFPVVDWFCLFIYLWVLTFPLEDCAEFGNFVITLINGDVNIKHHLNNIRKLMFYSRGFYQIWIYIKSGFNVIGEKKK